MNIIDWFNNIDWLLTFKNIGWTIFFLFLFAMAMGGDCDDLDIDDFDN